MKKLIFVMFLALAICQSVQAQNCVKDDPNSPSVVLKQRWSQIAPILLSEDIDKDEKKVRIDKIANGMFNFDLMAKLAMGKEHWKQMSDSQREKFTQLFVIKLKDAYWAKISLYTGQEVIFKEAVKKKASVHIPMVLVTEDKDFVILYKFHKPDKKKDRWEVYDVEIQGVSIIMTYRSQFDDILKNATYEELLTKLQEAQKD